MTNANTTPATLHHRTDDGGEILDPVILIRQKVRRCELAVVAAAEAHVDMAGNTYDLGRAVDALRAARAELVAAETAAADTNRAPRTFTWATDSASGTIEATDLLGALQLLKARGEWPTDDQIDDGAWGRISDAAANE